VLRKISFPANALRDSQLENVAFDECFFASSSLENTTLENCRFSRCQLARLDYFPSTVIRNVTMSESTVEAVRDSGRGLNYFEPNSVRSHLQHIGICFPDSTAELPLDAATEMEREEALVQFEKLLRYFMRSTHISESVIRMKLGGRGNAFISEIVPTLVAHGVFVEMENRGGDGQRRYKLGKPMEALNAALEGCGCTFTEFLSAVAVAG
jgi:hypothetical protein